MKVNVYHQLSHIYPIRKISTLLENSSLITFLKWGTEVLIYLYSHKGSYVLANMDLIPSTADVPQI